MNAQQKAATVLLIAAPILLLVTGIMARPVDIHDLHRLLTQTMLHSGTNSAESPTDKHHALLWLGLSEISLIAGFLSHWLLAKQATTYYRSVWIVLLAAALFYTLLGGHYLGLLAIASLFIAPTFRQMRKAA